jgi:Asp-tRNA(Asn)/Glu-tRNA(Gln) amidotransferase A subunit family amidase
VHFELFSLKPTTARTAKATRFGIWDSISSTPSPISKDVDSLVYIAKVIFSTESQKQSLATPPIPFNQSLFTHCLTEKKMVIGFYIDDEIIKACPTACRAVFKAIDILHKAGHTVLRFQPPCPKMALLLLAKLYCFHKTNPSRLQGTVRDYMTKLSLLFPMIVIRKIPTIIRYVVLKLVSVGMDDPLLDKLSYCFGGGSTVSKTRELKELMELEVEKEEYERLFALSWQQPDIDALICPVHATPPLPYSSTPFNWIGMFYSAIYNLLDYPAGVVPGVTRVSPTDGIPNAVQYAHHERYVPNANSHFNFIGVMALEETNHCFLEGKLTDLPVGVQVVGKPFEEEKVLAVMKIISSNI